MRKYDAVNGEQKCVGLCKSNLSTPLLNINDTTAQYLGISGLRVLSLTAVLSILYM